MMNQCKIVAKLKENIRNEATFESFQHLNDYEYNFNKNI